VNTIKKEKKMPQEPFQDPVPSFGGMDFADNPEPRCPCLLLLDVSGSMGGAPIDELNKGLQQFKEELCSDPLSKKRVEPAIVTFGGTVNIVSNFATAENFEPPILSAEGNTPMGAAIMQAIEMLKLRKEEYRSNGILFYRPWIFLITDGAPTDEWQQAAVQVKDGEDKKAFMFFTVGIQNADMSILSRIAKREPLTLKGLQFRTLFQWLSNSMSSVSRSAPSDVIPLENPKAPDGWAVNA
jgi:uncharacterized protein YegL